MEKDVEEIVEKKVEERMEKQKQEIREEVKQDLRQNLKNHKYEESEKISRRGFLKKLGAGAIGLGALSLAPAASKVTISDLGITENGNAFWHQGELATNLAGTNLQNDGSGNLEVVQGDGSGLDADTLDGSDATDIFSPSIPSDVSSSRSAGTWYQNTTGSALVVYISTETTSNGTQTHSLDFHINSSQTDNIVLTSYASSPDYENDNATVVMMVPDQAYYKASTSWTILRWYEQEL